MTLNNNNKMTKLKKEIIKEINDFWDKGQRIGINRKKYKDYTEVTAIRIFDWKQWEKLINIVKSK